MNKDNLIQYISDTWSTLRVEGQSAMLRCEYGVAPLYLRANDYQFSFLITADINREVDIKPKQFTNISISIEKLSSETKGIVITLTNYRFIDTFTKIAADVIGSTMHLKDEPEQVVRFVTRVNSWKNIFSRNPVQKLTSEEQLGLYGELEFLKALINEGFSTSKVIDSWKGADAEDKDFQFNNIGIEVKSSAKQDRLVKISNIRQLDATGFDALYLYYYSFAKSNGGVDTLPAQVDSIRTILVGSPYLDEFEAKLLAAGYNDSDKDEYLTSYSLSFEDSYIISDDFPKLTNDNTMAGILDSAYVVDLNVCDSFIKPYQSLMAELNKH